MTDDTTMSLALGNAIISDGGAVHALSAARAFDAWMRSKPNGALMRVLPVAIATLGHAPATVTSAIRAQA